MKKFLCAFILLFLCFAFPAGKIAFAETTPTYVVVANRANVFAEADLESEVLLSLSHGTVLSQNSDYYLEFSSDAPTEYKDGDMTFYKVLFEENEGYIFAEFVAQQNETLEAIPTFNAQTNAACKVYCADGTELSIEKGHRIYLYEKYNSHAARTKVVLLYDNKIVYGEIETKFINPDGVNPILISAIIIIVAILGIIFAWLFMKKRKNAKIKKK